MTAESIFEQIITTIDEAIFAEIGERREFSDEAEALLDEVQVMLISALGLPEDHHL
jgi:hypothetical protein